MGGPGCLSARTPHPSAYPFQTPRLGFGTEDKQAPGARETNQATSDPGPPGAITATQAEAKQTITSREPERSDPEGQAGGNLCFSPKPTP